ncbi:MAG TPA: murein L,D-transpeptidase catalytic domain family protein [Rhodanobacteraceae bacterium]|nr:murein L,D-transpeptidase catalytic domain family protein [Rhodanobacteraceae bacterium]
MSRIHLPLLLAVAASAAVSARTTSSEASTRAAAAVPAIPASSGELARLAPGADPKVLELALAAMRCAQADGVGEQAGRLAVIDYSRSSLEPRLWVFDLANDRLLYQELVAHGQGSGGDVPTRFSNDDGSHASSLGLFVTRDTYVGHNGYSLRMDGLEHGINDAAMSRAIVMHGAAYVNADAGRHMGRLGRSWGCPALRSAVAKPIIDVLKDGQFVFSYYPDQAWLTRSALLKCPAARLVRRDADEHDDSA